MSRPFLVAAAVAAVVLVGGLALWLALRPAPRLVEHMSVEIISPPPPPPANTAQ